jgi:FkbM family methyltransferase
MSTTVILDPLQYVQSKEYRGTVVVVGGNVGDDAIFFSRSCGFERVVAIEGIEAAAKNLLQDISQHQYGAGSIDVLATFVSSRPELFLNIDRSPNDSKWFVTEVPVGPDSIRVSAKRLDELCANRGNVDVIKINADAYELEILESGSGTLTHYNPDLCVEVSLGHSELITKMLESYGYLQAETLSQMHFYFVHVGRIAVAISRILSAAPFFLASRLVWRWKRISCRIAMSRRQRRSGPI